MEPVFIVLLAVFIIGLIALGIYQKHKRIKELTEWSIKRGLTFSEESQHGMDDEFPNFSCLRQGSNRYAYNVMTGGYQQWKLCAFDYHYETYSNDSKGNRQTHHHYFSAVMMNTGLPLKPLFIRREGFFDKVTEFFGYDDIDFESAEFSRNFYVKAEDKRWAYDVIQQTTMEFLMDSPNYTFQFDGPFILAYRSSTFSTIDFDNALAVIEGIMNRLPDYLLREMRGES